MEYIVLTGAQLNTIENWMTKHQEGFGDLWCELTVNTKKDGDFTFVKEFCGFANFRGDKLYAISEEVIRFLVALIDTHYGADHVYDACSAVVYNVCGDPDPRSLQKFIDKHI